VQGANALPPQQWQQRLTGGNLAPQSGANAAMLQTPQPPSQQVRRRAIES
jgi:hypothetical protein